MRPLIFAHRGANQEAAENTRAAFDQALTYALDGIETDVQLSRDEVTVLCHDRFLGKLGLPDKHIDDFDYAQLQGMNFSAHFSTGTKPEGIMSLEEFLGRYRMRCRLLIEIKNRDWELLDRHRIKVRQTLELIGATTDKEIMISSFDLASLVYANQCMPSCALVYNLEPEQTFVEVQHVLEEQIFLHGFCLPIASLNDAMIKLLRGQGKCIAVYTCNSDNEINLALGYGVDILISDVPKKALQMRNRIPAAG